VISIIKDIEDYVAIEHDLNRLVEWSNKWLIKFNADKFKVMHFGIKIIKTIIIIYMKKRLIIKPLQEV
jgi:hypothetical protein